MNLTIQTPETDTANIDDDSELSLLCKDYRHNALRLAVRWLVRQEGTSLGGIIAMVESAYHGAHRDRAAQKWCDGCGCSESKCRTYMPHQRKCCPDCKHVPESWNSLQSHHFKAKPR